MLQKSLKCAVHVHSLHKTLRSRSPQIYVTNGSQRLVCSFRSLFNRLKGDSQRCVTRVSRVCRCCVGRVLMAFDERTFSSVSSSSLYSSVSGSSSIALRKDSGASPPGTGHDAVHTQDFVFDKNSTHFLRLSMASSCWPMRNCATPIRSETRGTKASP